ncbi:Uncharacterised protein [Serratia liquefaciens]|nr:Uncharacterised protein [Serratia liquefaciens]CAI1098604.1 Uncharacterised protein [Serratia liquefaciens]
MFTGGNSYGRTSLGIVSSNNLCGRMLLHSVVNVQIVTRSGTHLELVVLANVVF